MINKNISKILKKEDIKKIVNLNLNSRPEELNRISIINLQNLLEKTSKFFLLFSIIFSICLNKHLSFYLLRYNHNHSRLISSSKALVFFLFLFEF